MTFNLKFFPLLLSQVTWFKDGKELKPGKQYNIAYSAGIASLECGTAEVADSGKYRCVAENKMGEDESVCNVSVSGKFKLKK